MGRFVAQKAIKMLAATGVPLTSARVGILGLTFKENVPDLRNSRVIDIISELKEYGAQVIVHDPMADAHEAHEELNVKLSDWSALKNLDAMIVTVAHKQYQAMPLDNLLAPLKDNGALLDIKGMLEASRVPRKLSYWCL